METEKYSEKLFRERSDEAWKTAPDTIDDEKMERMQRDIMSRISTVDDIFAKKEKKGSVSSGQSLRLLPLPLSLPLLAIGQQDEETRRYSIESSRKTDRRVQYLFRMVLQ